MYVSYLFFVNNTLLFYEADKDLLEVDCNAF